MALHSSSLKVVLDYEAVRRATNSFAPSQQIGNGGFGPVYQVSFTLDAQNALNVFKESDYLRTKRADTCGPCLLLLDPYVVIAN